MFYVIERKIIPDESQILHFRTEIMPLIRYLLRYPELLPHASPYVAREMSLAVSGALANRGLTTVRLT